jgi:hypothetical protein
MVLRSTTAHKHMMQHQVKIEKPGIAPSSHCHPYFTDAVHCQALTSLKLPCPSLLSPVLECAAESDLVRYTHEPAPYQAQVHESPTNEDFGPLSAQKTCLMGEGCSSLYVVLPRWPLSILNVGLNLTIFPVTH